MSLSWKPIERGHLVLQKITMWSVGGSYDKYQSSIQELTLAFIVFSPDTTDITMKEVSIIV